MARPIKMTEQVLKDLRAIFLIGATQEEACRYSGISVKTLWNYTEKHPEFLQEIKAWQEDSILKARRKVIEEIPKDINTAKWYLERKVKTEFAQRQELTGDEGAAINVIIEDTYAKQPKFRTDNNNAEADDLAEDSSE
jgi:hypothetical protein